MAPLWTMAAALAAAYLGLLGAGKKGLLKITPAITLALATAPESPLVASAFGCCALGDLFLLWPKQWFLHGLASFLVGHVLFIVSFATMSDIAPPIWAVVPVAIATVLMLVLLLPHLRGVLRFAVPLYAGALGGMAIMASTISPIAFAGGMTFIASDAVLALDRFRAPIRGGTAVVMTTYYGALLLLSAAVLGLG